MMMTILKKCSPIPPQFKLCTALAIIALLSVSQVTFAQELNRKVYPGTFCQPGTGGGERPPEYRYDERGRILNLSLEQRLEVICPVVRDETASTAGISQARVRFLAAFQPSNDDDSALSCFLHSRALYGTQIAVLRETNVGVPAGNRVLRFNQIPSTDQSGGPGYFHFRCFIPARDETHGVSGIISYWVDEIVTPQAQPFSQADEDDQ
jgi:hypothetical protein